MPFAVVFVSKVALAATHSPAGYLVPAPGSIPEGLSQMQRPYSPYDDDSYVLEYRAKDNQACLFISENTASPGLSYDQLRRGYDIDMGPSSGSVHTQKVTDIEQLGTRGTLFEETVAGVHGYDLIANDNGHIFRIQAQDGPWFHFTKDMIIQIVNHLTRQS